MRRRIFIKKLTPAELGETKTHEKYIRLPNDFNYEVFFQEKGQQNNSVIQIDFEANSKNDGENVAMKFVYYANSNKEKRIPSLGQVFDKYNASDNDVIYLESITEGNTTRINVSFLNSSEIQLYTSPIFYVIDDDESKDEKVITPQIKRPALQQIFYGAPGTGKSHTIKECTEGKDVIRTTFHPDTDYSTFVGAYKPTTKSFPVTTVIGTKAVAVEDEEGHKMTEDKIVYEFVPQAFLQAYVAAWQKFDKVEDLSQPKEEYLVIEEINRGNCAQIFGDLFQLLDRGDGGFSEYPIKADADMKKYLQKALKETNLEGIKADLNGLFKGEDIAKQVKDGNILLLPNNLYIWATMNTSDQSLFPIDSAFKRRWDWQYVPISDAGKQWVIRVNGNDYSWWNFLEEINNRIYQATYSEDKKLGYFFCKAKDSVIDADVFVSKVVFYLWNDVFKDTEFEGDAFKDGDNGKLSFDKFYTVEGDKTKVVSDKVELFLQNLKLVPIANADETEYEGQEPDEHADEKREWSETELKRYEFWQEFLKYANSNNEEFAKYFGSRKTPSHDKWYNFPLGHPDCYLVAEQTRSRNELELQVYFNETTENYHKLLLHKHEIEEEMGVQYEWNELPNKKASKITETKKNVNLDEKSTWQESFDFFIDRLLRMRVTFLKYLKP